MANIRKSFNFRNGVQVDNDNFVVNANGLVGIGTSTPTEAIDAIGNAKISGLTTTSTLGVAQTANFYGDLKVGTGITMSGGIVTAVSFYGDGSTLSNVYAISTTGWVAQGVGLHTLSRSVGIGTTNPVYKLQIGLDPVTGVGVGITNGNIIVSGIITATTFVGNVTGTATTATNLSNAANITTGTISNDRLPSNIDKPTGIITASSFVGDVTGTATTATNLSNAANITTGTISDARLPNVITSDIDSSGISTFTTLKVGTAITMSSGIITATTFSGSVTGDLTGVASTATKLETARNFSVSGDVLSHTVSFDGTSNVALGVTLSGTFSANTSGIITANTFSGIVTSTNGTFDDLRINKSSAASLVVTSTTNSSVSIGESVGAGNSSAQFLYTPGTGRLDITNYDVGGVSINLHEGTGTGTTESFNVKYDNTKQFEVTYDGKVGVNRGGTPLTRNFEVGGDAFISQNAVVSGILTINQGGPNEITLGDGSPIPIRDDQNFNTVSGISTFNQLNVINSFSYTGLSTVFFGGEVGIGTTSNDGFLTGPNQLKAHVEGSTWAKEGFYTAGKLVITDKADGSIHTDDRVIPSSPVDYGAVVPFVDYGDFQVETGGASLITNNVLMVPGVGQATVGFGTTNGGLIPASFLPGGNRYLTKVGINTYYARSIFDVGTASTTMNSYFIPPSLTQSEIDIMQDLWNTPTGTGYTAANKVTPNGLVPGGIVYNKTTDKIQQRSTASTFRDLSSSSSSVQTIGVGVSEVVFNDVPAWADKITIIFLNISCTSSGLDRHFRVQLGTSSGIVTTNYDSETNQGAITSPGYAESDDGFIMYGTTSGQQYSGHMMITKFDDTTYVETHILSPGKFGDNGIRFGGGNVESISDTITRLRISIHDDTNFTGGKVKVLYEG